MKPAIMWALQTRKGHILTDYTFPTRKQVVDHCTRSASPANPREKIWRRWRKEGYRLIKVEVRPVA